VGITVPGSKSDQQFHAVSGFATDGVKHNIVLQLLGKTKENTPVVAPVTVKAKPKCTTCGHTNKATAQYCNKCGTALVIYA
jgi:tRNA(Ile2) C34 agmatinyltransferase TiaS